MSALSDLVKYAQMGDVVYSRGGTIKYYSRAKEAAAELAAKDAEIAALRNNLLRAIAELEFVIGLSLMLEDDDPYFFDKRNGEWTITKAQTTLAELKESLK